MDINTTLAQRAYGAATRHTAPKPGPGAEVPSFVKAAETFAQTVQRGEIQANAALTSGADPHALVTALAETKLAVETAVTVRDKVVEAYQEILRMQV